MDKQDRRDMYTMAEWAATLDALDRLHERRVRRRRIVRFWLNIHQQVVYEPTVAVATPGAAETASAPPLGVASGAAGSQATTPTHLVSGSRLPGRPHL